MGDNLQLEDFQSEKSNEQDLPSVYSFTSSVIERLIEIDNMIKQFTDTLRGYQASTQKIDGEKDSLDCDIDDIIRDIRKDMQNKLNQIQKCIEDNKKTGWAEAFKYKDEIKAMLKENIQIRKQIAELKMKINQMETTIGHSNPKGINK